VTLLERLEAELYAGTPDEIRLLPGLDFLALIDQADRELGCLCSSSKCRARRRRAANERETQ
jgi:hypothetical protein